MRKVLFVLLLLSILLLTACNDISPSSSYTSSLNFDNNSIAEAPSDNTSETLSSIETVSNESVSGNSMTVCEHNYIVTKNILKCTENGYKEYKCTKCGNTYKETIGALGHEYKNTEVAPTCTTDGYYVPVCQRCGFALPKETIAATGHNFSGTLCTVCGIRDTDKARGMLTTWFETNSIYDNTTYGNTYRLPSNNNYYIWASGTNSSFSYLDDNTFLHIQVYGFEKNKCYVTFKKDGNILEGEFPMDSLHSSVRIYFNKMSGDRDLIPVLQNKIDDFLLKFENELLKPQINITLKDLGFTLY